jgi:hypothetical protein
MVLKFHRGYYLEDVGNHSWVAGDVTQQNWSLNLFSLEGVKVTRADKVTLYPLLINC